LKDGQLLGLGRKVAERVKGRRTVAICVQDGILP
jgi:hypothetical protein